MKTIPLLMMAATLALSFGQQAGRLLRVPKIYNTLISSDEELIPSLAYKAVSPIVKSIAPSPYFPYAPVVNVATHEPVVIPPQESYQSHFEQDPQVLSYDRKGVYNDLISSLLTLNQSLSNSMSAEDSPGPRGKAKQERFGDIRNNRNRNPSVPDVPPPPIPVRIKDDAPQETPARQGQEFPPPPVGAI
ncbi:uncharacterized protein [Bemisia tabaci]|uniref:uncharacterized protein isoform X1 n=2 Tax=Bemisia tabaci TaxID=7038 RepID=UPI003B28CF2A